LFFVIIKYLPNLYLYSFPTRRSSDLDIIFEKTKIKTSKNNKHLPIKDLFINKLRPLSSHSVHILSRGVSRVNPSSFYIVGNAFSDRKSTRLNSSHVSISYAVFCLKKK